jgi:O-antigen/teichoic acid export membrane protein
VFNTVGLACQDTVKGYERTDFYVATQLASQFLNVVVVVPTLLLGGGLTELLVVQSVVAALSLALVLFTTRRAGVGSISVGTAAFQELFGQGKYFMSFGIAMALKGNVDAVLLTKFTSPEVVGWQAAAARLAGFLAIPASALIVALYPTLSRLNVQDREGYVTTLRNALRGTMILAVPMAACCGLYRELGIQLFSKEAFGPAQNNLLVIAVSLLFVYVSMTLGTALMAAGRQRAWAGVQMLCVVVSLGLGPILIPWFQKHYGNGGIGVCVAGVVCDIIMVVAAFVLMGRGILDRTLTILLIKVLAAGGVMVGVGLLLDFVTPFVVAPITLIAYFACLWLVGGMHRSEFAAVRDAVLRRLKRA